MAWDAGAVEARLTLDKSQFTASLAAAKAEAKDGISVPVRYGTGDLAGTFAEVRSAMQRAGLADLLDVNLNPSQISSQLALLKRRIQQTGITDLLDIDVNQAGLTDQLGKLRGETISIPVGFDVGTLPKISGAQDFSDKINIQGVALAEQQLAALNTIAGTLDDTLTNKTPAAARAAEYAVGNLNTQGTKGYGIWGLLTSHIQLFGGALTELGAPEMLAAAGVIHILIDGLIETTAVLVPAAIAFGVFGAAAYPVLKSIYTQMSAVSLTSKALGQNIYPLAGGFQKMAAAAKPEVYELFGDALVVMGAKGGQLTGIITSAGKALDTLGERATVALTSGGMSTFLSKGVTDMSEIGDIVGNIFGTVGNLLKVMPGYAEILLAALDDVTKGLEAVTGSSIGQFLAGTFLAFHGFVLWGGLAATAAVYLGNGLVTLASKFGLAEAGALSFDAVQFGTGIKLMLSYTGDLAVGLFTMAGAEDVATASTGVLEAAMIALDAVNPLVWVGLAAAALGGLIYWLDKSTSATSAYDNAVQNALANAPVTVLGTDLVYDRMFATSQLKDAQDKLNATQEYGTVVNLHTGATGQAVTAAYQAQAAIVSGYAGELATVQGEQSNYNTLLKSAGGNIAVLEASGINLNKAITQQGEAFQQNNVQVKAYVDSMSAMDLGIGRTAASNSALTNTFITGTLPALQKMTQAEDAVMAVILAGPQAFVSFEQAIQQTGKDFGLTTRQIQDMTGETSTALTKLSDFYTTVVPAGQKLIDSLQQQGISTGNLTTVIADEVRQMAAFTGGTTEAKSTLVDLINNALGPGTVSLQTLNHWVGQNSGTTAGYNKILAETAIDASNLAGVLETSLNQQFIADEIAASGAKTQIKALADAMTGAKPNADAIQGAAQNLYNTLVDVDHQSTGTAQDFVRNLDPAFKNTGDTATTSSGNVSTLNKQILGSGIAALGSAGNINTWAKAITNVPSHKTVDFLMLAKGEYDVSQVKYFDTAHAFVNVAGGGMISGGTPGKDSVLVNAMPGEVVVPTAMVNAGAVDHLRGSLPGFADGGVVGNLNSAWISGSYMNFQQQSENAASAALSTALRSATTAAAQAALAAASGPGIAGPGGGNALLNARLAQTMMPAWGSGAQWAAWDDLEMREAGWNQFARNPGSGAYGIPQALPPGKMGAAANPPQSNPHAQISWMINYIEGRYGNPINADSHERAYHWYDNGGMLPVGMSMALNTTGKPETVVAGTDMDELISAVDNVADLLSTLITVASKSPNRTASGISAALSGASRSAAYSALYPTGR